MPEWHTDPRLLAAGNARGLPGGDPAATPGPDDLQNVAGWASVNRDDLTGDLDTAAARLGVNVADLVKMRRSLGIATTHRRPSRLARLFRRG
jgi:hypothetical protein